MPTIVTLLAQLCAVNGRKLVQEIVTKRCQMVWFFKMILTVVFGNLFAKLLNRVIH